MTVLAIIGAAAAAIAAVAAVLTLRATGKRDERAWRRDTMIEVLVTFLNAGFAMPIQHGYEDRRRGEDIEPLRLQTIDQQEVQAFALTRLRFYAPPEVIEKAEQARAADFAAIEAVYTRDPLLQPDQWAAIRDERRRARQHLIDAARESMGLRPSPPVIDFPHVRPS